MFVLFFVYGRLFVFNWSTFPLAESERKFLNTWTWQPYLKKLNGITEECWQPFGGWFFVIETV